MFLTVYPTNRLTAQDSFPAGPPAPTRLKPVRFPPFQEALLPSGLNLVVIENHEQPVVSVTLSFRAGSSLDPRGKEGLSAIVAELLTKGTATRSAEQIAAAIEGVGGSLTASSSTDFLTLTSDVLSDRVDLAFELLGDVVKNATYPGPELELARTRFLSALQDLLSRPDAVAERVFAKELYGEHPYGRRPTSDSYRAITRDDVVRFAAQRLRPAGALLVVAGDVTPARARELVTTALADWRGAPAALTPPPPAPARAATGILLVHRPGSVQSDIVVGNTTTTAGDTGYYAARLATQVLGGAADSRLFMILRERHGWTYGAGASLVRYRGLGHWQAETAVRTEVTDSALGELLHQIDRIRSEPIPDSELGNAKGYIVGSFPLTIETPGQIATQVSTAKLLGLPPNYLQTYRERLSAVTPARARAAAARTYRRNALTIVVVGDAAKIYERLRPIAPIRLVDVDGKPLSPADLNPTAGGPVALDRAQIVPRTDSFRVVIQGNPMGALLVSTQESGDSLIYTERTTIGPTYQQSSTVVLDGTSLAVRRVEQTGQVQTQKTETHLTYDAGRVKGRVVTPQPTGTPKATDVDTTVAAGTYDDNALNLLLPALALEQGKTFHVSVFNGNSATTDVLTVKVGAPESVTVPAGTFQAYRLELTGGQAPSVVWVTTAAPRRTVKTQFVGAPFVFELVK